MFCDAKIKSTEEKQKIARNVGIQCHCHCSSTWIKSYLLKIVPFLSPWLFYDYCQAKVQKSESLVKSKEKVKKSQGLGLCLLYCHLSTPPTHPTINFSATSRGLTTKCYTILETSNDPWLKSKVRKNRKRKKIMRRRKKREFSFRLTMSTPV